MGERHQVLLIGRVRRPDGTTRYRCVAAIHDQWCYGVTPLRKAYRFSLLAQQPDNASLIHEELQNYQENVEKLPLFPCVYISSLLEMVWAENTRDRRLVQSINKLQVDFLQTQSLWNCLDNNTGLTVIDVTDPRNLAICFVTNDKALTPKLYLLSLYGPEIDDREIVRNLDDEENEAVQLLDGIRIIPQNVLAETFPLSFERLSSSGEPVNDPDRGEHPDELPTLVTLSMHQAVRQAVEDDRLELIEHILDLQGMLQPVLLQLKKSPKFPASAARFFSKAFSTLPNFPKELDLSGYNFSGKQVVELAGDPDAVESLDLSHNSVIDKDGLYEILLCLGNLKYLNIFSTSLSNSDLRSLLQDHHSLFFRLHHVFHPLLISARDPIPNPLSVRIDLGNGRDYSSYWGRQLSHWVPFISGDALVGKFNDLIEQLTVQDKEKHGHYSFGIGTSESAIRVILASGVDTLHGQGTAEEWHQRRISTFTRNGLAETWMKEGYVLIFRLRQNSTEYKLEWEYGVFSSRSANATAAEVGPQQGNDCVAEDQMRFAETQPQEDYVQEVLDFATFFKRLETQGYSVSREKLQSLLDTVQAHPEVHLTTLEGCLESLATEDDYKWPP
ncbi:hypothetical protein FA15DRAFT_620886 [Coprinopsis marcescibilis]|uniref:RNI-like protein n=1 Tax=Coprinopsis marcescibilis TaxID=230819 RepID=A0A5C3KSK8_COPMA|nr:hypothetical protein FA15DRAFT_620886 [Coprinopsis marcescibilis]